MISGASSYMPIFRISNADAVDMMIEKYDLDKSGDLNVDEAQNVPILSRKNFETADSFGDGKLTEKEFMTYLDQMKLEIGQGSATNPMALLMGGSPINEDVFSQIVSEVSNNEGKQNFIDYMLHLTKEYEAAMKAPVDEEGSSVDLSA
ncbi:hypothetical protein SAMN04488056_103192 [Cohaesibacter marisflavi]|uniref:EF hand n=1 Tax=Cohaesibacter marisflavi TaxID=655353 RepID=A0A1I5EID4_9HYPH|nr:hypothetical protein [Cohaesibacter marisflavi]SFO11083.1 hypothetical protein SAMN04488056_103192 [Cohaesibacter marisflavi]